MLYNYPESIEQAAKILDEALPDWADTIEIDYLDMDCTRNCILGQLYGYDINGIHELFGYETDYELIATLPCQVFGPYASIKEWTNEINKRLSNYDE